MRYLIISVDDSRKRYTDKIRAQLDGWEEVPFKGIDGRRPGVIENYLNNNRWLTIVKNHLRLGQVGIWLSVIEVLKNVINDGELITFEDDAILNRLFVTRMEKTRKLIPNDCDFFTLFIPRDHWQWFNYELVEDKKEGLQTNKEKPRYARGNPAFKTNNKKIVRSNFQRYGGVSMLYTPRGAERIISLVKQDGLLDQYDNSLYRYSREGKLNGYCLNPNEPDLVSISGIDESIVHNTEVYK